MDVARPDFLPDPSADHEEMEALQRTIAETAVFADDLGLRPGDITIAEPLSLEEEFSSAVDRTAPVVAGVDQAFENDMAISAVVAIQDGSVVEVTTARTPLDIPYIPGLLAFREGPPIVEALRELSVSPDLLVFDGSGRIHFRQAGIATHMGVLFDVPAIGVAKNLLCGTLESPIDSPLAAGTRIAITADDGVSAPPGTVLGYAFQSRQFPNPARRHVNPLYVSPGHRLSAETAVSFVEATGAGYKLPEPTRLADRAADAFKRGDVPG